MDVTAEYAKMCEQATMLQHFKTQHNFGDLIYRDGKSWCVNGYDVNEGCNQYRAIYNIDDSFFEQWFSEGFSETVWLPRQDDLQKMALKANISLQYLLVIMFPEFVANDRTPFQVTTVEKYWLMFIMDLIYNQYWCGDMSTWVNKPTNERKIIEQQ